MEDIGIGGTDGDPALSPAFHNASSVNIVRVFKQDAPEKTEMSEDNC